jgi:hypothetical protein
MRLVRWTLPIAVALVVTPPLAAQGNSQCAQFNQFPFAAADYNVCNAAIDGTRLFHPVAGLLVSGGDPVLGSFHTFGGFPHLSVTARVNATKLTTPDLNYDGTTGTTVGKGDEITAPAPLVEAGLGLYGGYGATHLLALDLLGSAQLLPVNAVNNLTVENGARHIGDIALGLGIGGRVGITSGKGIVPALSVSVMHRSIPRITYGNVTTGGDQYSFSVDLGATNLRAMAGYKLGPLEAGAGLGWDKYTGTAKLAINTQAQGAQNVPDVDLDASRAVAFLGAGINLPVLKIGAEIGWQFGKAQSLATTFQGNNPGDNRLFGSAGVRLAF